MTHRLGYAAAQNWRMRARETRAIAEEMKEIERKELMLKIAAIYEELAEWEEKTQRRFGKKRA
jgi:hypothetical protein